MWSPIDVFYIVWFCNFMPCENARFNAEDIIKFKENSFIRESINLRNEN